jgi:Zn-dependent protease
MNPDQLAFGFLEYVVFLLSTTCHEASHALVAKWGGDTTALEGGQVSLNPWPHIRREPFGMVVIPLIGIVTMSGLIGWASAPYNAKWAMEHPKHAARMSLAGPAANFGLAILAGIVMRIGLATGSFVAVPPLFSQIVAPATVGGVGEGVATILSLFFSLNILLGFFNLIPFPPLDGYGVLGLFLTASGAVRLQQLKLQMGAFSFLGLVIAWQVFSRIFPDLFEFGVRIFHFY